MFRVMLCLPLCLLFSPAQAPHAPAAPQAGPAAEAPADDGRPLPDRAGMERLAREKPLEFLETALVRYRRGVKGYTATFQKQERLAGRLQLTEIIQTAYREKPHAVYFEWKEGARLAERTLYVEGENQGMMLARPYGRLARAVAGDVVSRDPGGEDAKKSGRYSIKEFGLKRSMERALASWKPAQQAGALKVEVLEAKKIKEAGDRVCLGLRRTEYARPEEDGITEATFYFDVETWLQVGSVLKGEGGKLLGEYFYRDLRLNPEFKAEQFTRAALAP